jgi:hypothetical protein
MIYAIVFCACLYPLLLLRKRLCQTDLQEKRRSNISVYIYITIILCLFVGLRGINVGSDTATYYYHFQNLKNESFISMIEKYKTDVGFYLITMVLAKILKNYNVYLILTSLIYLIPVAVLIYKKSTNPLYSYFLFFCFGLFTFSMSTLRQTIAIGLCIIAYLLKDKPIKKLLALVLAISIQ